MTRPKTPPPETPLNVDEKFRSYLISITSGLSNIKKKNRRLQGTFIVSVLSEFDSE